MKRHKCILDGCPVQIATRMLMCPGHWLTVPKELRDEVWRWYQPGQERHPERISLRYEQAAHKAMIAALEFQATQTNQARQGILL